MFDLERYPGTIEPPANNRAVSLLFSPADKRIPKIRIKSRQLQRLLHKRIVVCIDGWDGNSRYLEQRKREEGEGKEKRRNEERRTERCTPESFKIGFSSCSFSLFL